MTEFKDKETFYNYLNDNNIKGETISDLCGRIKLMRVIKVRTTSFVLESVYCYKYYAIVEIFDGKLKYIDMLDLQDEIKSYDMRKVTNRQFKIVNAEFNGTGEVIEIPEIEYIPTYKAIYEYILDNLDLNIVYNDLETAKVNMSEQQMKELKTKLSMIGAVWYLVDYRTIAVTNSKDSKLLIYTMQPKIITE